MVYLKIGGVGCRVQQLSVAHQVGDRLDYVEATLKAAYKARLESGQTYQARQVANGFYISKSLRKHMQMVLIRPHICCCVSSL